MPLSNFILFKSIVLIQTKLEWNYFKYMLCRFFAKLAYRYHSLCIMIVSNWWLNPWIAFVQVQYVIEKYVRGNREEEGHFYLRIKTDLRSHNTQQLIFVHKEKFTYISIY